MSRTRYALVALVLVAAAPALGQDADPPPYLRGDERGLFPRWGDRWTYDVRAPAGPGRARFTRVEAVPNKRQGWDAVVTCGLVSLRDGREDVLVRGRGDATRGRIPIIGGTWAAPGEPTRSIAIHQGPADLGRLRLRSELTDPRCASGWGDLSSGD